MQLVTAATPTHHRDLNTGFIVERYHRAFDEEIDHLRCWLRHATGKTEELAPSLATLNTRLRQHTIFQETQLFAAFEGGKPCPPKLFDAWAMDALLLFGALEGVRGSCAALDPRLPLIARVRHLGDEIQDHLAAEAKVLARWTGFGA